jgi:hypothetical protein
MSGNDSTHLAIPSEALAPNREGKMTTLNLQEFADHVMAMQRETAGLIAVHHVILQTLVYTLGNADSQIRDQLGHNLSVIAKQYEAQPSLGQLVLDVLAAARGEGPWQSSPQQKPPALRLVVTDE